MIQIKKTVIALSLIGSHALYAGSMGTIIDKTNPKERLYAGVGIGGTFNNEQLNTQNVIFGNTVSVSLNSNNLVGNLFMGYGHTFMNSLFLGVEANTYFPHRTINLYSPGVTVIGPIYQDQYSISDFLGLDFLPGYRVNSDLLVYGRVGLAFRDISINQPQNVADSPSYFNSGHTIGGRFGAGVSYTLREHLAASLDYYYSQSPTFSSSWQLFNLQYNLKSHTNYLGVSLVYTI